MKLLFISSLLLPLALAGDVITLDDSSFKSRISSEPLALVKFYAPWCGHCKKMAPDFEKAATILKGNDPPVALIDVDCTENQATCGEYGVSGYPTLKVFKSGTASDYNGGRTLNDFVKAMAGQAGSASLEIKDLTKWKAIAASKVPVVVGFFENAAKAKSFMTVGEELRESVKFAHTFNEEVAEAAGFKNGDMVLFRPAAMKNKFEDSQVVYDKEKVTTGLIRSWAASNAKGLAPVVAPDGMEDLGYPQVIAIFNVDYERDPKGTQYWRNRVMKVAVPFVEKHKWNFAVGSATEFGGLLQDIGINFEKTPKVVLFESKDSKFVMTEEFTMDSFTAFLDSYAAGDLKPHMKTEGEQDNVGKANKILTASNFKDEVDGSQDALIYFYAPWCGHCKTLAPKWEEAAEKMKDDDVVIGKMDATANDVPSGFEVKGFPTIFWIPKGGRPEKFTGGREAADLIQWVDEHKTTRDEL